MSELTLDDIDRMHKAKDLDGLVQALYTLDYDVRDKAGKAITEINDTRVVEPLIKILKTKRNSGIIRARAIRILSELKDTRAVDVFIETLSDSDLALTHMAAGGLGDLGDKRAVDPLIKHMKSKEDDTFNQDAILSLGNLGDEKVIPFLIDYLKGLDETTAYSARWALEKLKTDNVLSILLNQYKSAENDLIRELTMSAIGVWGDAKAIPFIISLLDDNDEISLHNSAVIALGRIRDVRVFDYLVRFIGVENDTSIRKNAIVGLGTLGDDRAISPLRQILDDKDVGDFVLKALINLGDIESLRTIHRSRGVHLTDEQIKMIVKDAQDYHKLPIRKEW